MINEVEYYINKFPGGVKNILLKVRDIIQKSAPKNSEVMFYGVPGFKVSTKNFVLYAAFKNHIGLYPYPTTIKHFSNELKGYKTSKGGIQFPFDNVPYDLIARIAIYEFKK